MQFIAHWQMMIHDPQENAWEAAKRLENEIPGLRVQIVDEFPSYGGGWPYVTLVGELPVLVDALERLEEGDGEDIERLKSTFRNLEPFTG